MNDNKKEEVDSEAIMMTLDQISQTMEIMTSVVGRLRGYITEKQELSSVSNQEDCVLEAFNANPHTRH